MARGDQTGPAAAPIHPGAGLMQIGQVAERTGLSLRTIRFYEENGLVVPTTRSEGGYRLYSGDDVARLEVIKQMKPLGFSLQEMQQLLSLLHDLAQAAEEDRPPLLNRLEMFHAAAAARVTGLREQLDVTENFAVSLARHLPASLTRRLPREDGSRVEES
jgi:MerR family transcriptional regulator, copper efflux regulator